MCVNCVGFGPLQPCANRTHSVHITFIYKLGIIPKTMLIDLTSVVSNPTMPLALTPLIQTWVNFNPSKYKQSHAQ